MAQKRYSRSKKPLNGDVDKILLAEDTPADVKLARFAFEEVPGIQLRVVENGEALLADLHDQSTPMPDLILLDINMPKINGFDALREIKASTDPQVRRIPVVMLTTSRLNSDITKAYDLGAAGYIAKPVEYEKFEQVMGSLHDFWFKNNVLPSRKGMDL